MEEAWCSCHYFVLVELQNQTNDGGKMKFTDSHGYAIRAFRPLQRKSKTNHFNLIE